jgi:hypothetical protein
MNDAEDRVRESFQAQAGYCRGLGSPFTAELCEILGERLSPHSTLGARVLGWTGNPAPTHDSVPLRLTGGLHALALRKTDSAWSALYPPSALPDRQTLARALDEVLVRFESDLLPWLDLPPQTNEVGRSAGLMAGLLFLAGRRNLPFSLYELGSSGGLNMVLDRYSYTLGTTLAGPASPVHLAPAWTGPSPAPADVKVIARRGVDQAPIDIGTAFGRERLAAYVWPDQIERLNRVRAALQLAATDPPTIDTEDAASWVERTIAAAPVAGVHRVLMHSVTFQYFTEEGQCRVAAHAEKVGAQARPDAPFSWLRMEQTSWSFGVRVRTWPGGEDQLLAEAQAHGAWMKWVAEGR